MDSVRTYDIRAITIPMQAPVLLNGHANKRSPKNKEQGAERFIVLEAFLRKKAYKNTSIKTSPVFFTDADMQSEYFLVVIYEEISNTPLLSARHYYDKSVIAKYLKGDNAPESGFRPGASIINVDDYAQGKVFLADRLSGNVSNKVYRQCREKIFSLYYAEIVNYNKNCTLILMVRLEKRNKQLNKYLKMGFRLAGTVLHNGKEHSIIIIDLSDV